MDRENRKTPPGHQTKRDRAPLTAGPPAAGTRAAELPRERAAAQPAALAAGCGGAGGAANGGNKCHASSNRCLTSSNKEATRNKCLTSSNNKNLITSKALVFNSFLLLLAMHLFLVASCYY